MIVVDTNVLVSASITGAGSESALRLLKHDPHWCAPVLWRSEYRNVMAGYLRRAALSREQVNAAYSHAAGLVNGFEAELDTDDVLDLIEVSDCTAYDCEFVALAKRLGCRLVTMDEQVLRAFPGIAVPLRQ